jgi:hypothetical protein
MVRILPTCVPLILLRPSIPLGPTLGKILRKLKRWALKAKMSRRKAWLRLTHKLGSGTIHHVSKQLCFV